MIKSYNKISRSFVSLALNDEATQIIRPFPPSEVWKHCILWNMTCRCSRSCYSSLLLIMLQNLTHYTDLYVFLYVCIFLTYLQAVSYLRLSQRTGQSAAWLIKRASQKRVPTLGTDSHSMKIPFPIHCWEPLHVKQVGEYASWKFSSRLQARYKRDKIEIQLCNIHFIYIHWAFVKAIKHGCWSCLLFILFHNGLANKPHLEYPLEFALVNWS